MRTLIAGGLVADGGGGEPYAADVLVDGERIAAVGTPSLPASTVADAVVDASGRVTSPGFVDVHSHDDNAPLLADETAKILQGVTTEVVGNCGASLAPLGRDGRSEEQLTRLRRLFPIADAPWHSFAELLGVCDEAGYVTNYAPLVGHGALRMSVMGLEARPPAGAELDAMGASLEEALAAGAFGLSSGLMYAPGMFADAEELAALTRRLGPEHIYATHMRNESDHLLRSIDEALEVARRSGCRLQISHLKAAGRRSRGTMSAALEALDTAREGGTAVSHDVYPYEAASTELVSCLPPWAHEGSVQSLLDRLQDDGARRRMRREVEDTDSTDWDNAVASCGYDGIVVAATSSGDFVGESIAAIAERLDLEPFDAMAHVLSVEALEVAVIEFCMDEADIVTALSEPHGMVGSDGLPPGTGGKPHPRRFGTFPRVLRSAVRESGVLSLGEAVRKMTSLPAETFSLRGRGVVEEGAIADLVVFDPATVGDVGTYDDPVRSPVGIDLVMLGGEVTVRDGRYLGVRRGRRLRPGS